MLFSYRGAALQSAIRTISQVCALHSMAVLPHCVRCRLAEVISEAEAKDGEVEELEKRKGEVRQG